MALVLAGLIEVVAIGLALLTLFAGSMRTTGGTTADIYEALIVLGAGTLFASVLALSHFFHISW